MEGYIRDLEERLDRIELAISSMAAWLVQVQTGFNAQDAQGIECILQGKYPQQEEHVMSEVQGEVRGRVDVFRVVYTNQDGNHTALVFRAPVEGTVYKQGEMFGMPGAFECVGNDQGEIPQIEEGPQGISWSWQK